MNKNYQPGDRVIVSQGTFKGQCGEVVRPQDEILSHGYIVKLDEKGIEERILKGYLEMENLSPDEIDTQIKEVKNLIEKESDKVSDKVKKELPEHLTHLQKALKSKDKSESENEYTYILKEMKRVFDSKLVEENISLKKLNHCWRNLLK